MKVKKVRKLIYAEYICRNLFPVNTVILTLENGNQIAYLKGKMFYLAKRKWHQIRVDKSYMEIINKFYPEKRKINENWTGLMKHERCHKKGSGGNRICTNQINGPLKWKEVTEIAHWEGVGNASVVAASIR